MPVRGLKRARTLASDCTVNPRDVFDEYCMLFNVKEKVSTAAWILFQRFGACITSRSEGETVQWMGCFLFLVDSAMKNQCNESTASNVNSIVSICNMTPSVFLSKVSMICRFIGKIVFSDDCSSIGRIQTVKTVNRDDIGEREGRMLPEVGPVDHKYPVVAEERVMTIRKVFNSVFSQNTFQYLTGIIKLTNEGFYVTNTIAHRIDKIICLVFEADKSCEYTQLRRLIWLLFIWAKRFLHHSSTNKNSSAFSAFRPSDYTRSSLQLLFGVFELIAQDCYLIGLENDVLVKDINKETAERFLCTAVYPQDANDSELNRRFTRLTDSRRSEIIAKRLSSGRRGCSISVIASLSIKYLMDTNGIISMITNFLVPLIDSHSWRRLTRSTLPRYLLCHPLLNNMEHNIRMLETEYSKGLKNSIGLFDESTFITSKSKTLPMKLQRRCEYERLDFFRRNFDAIEEENVITRISVPLDPVGVNVIQILYAVERNLNYGMARICRFMGERKMGKMFNSLNKAYEQNEPSTFKPTLTLFAVTFGILVCKAPANSFDERAALIHELYEFCRSH
ncbi:hypothetical protein ACOME3_009250 [Neoechinorhynchus agilis]